MSYSNGLKALRAKMIENSTGMEAPETKGLESFIPSRSQSAPQETTEDLMTKGASWVSEIKKASLEFKKAYEAATPKASPKSALGAFVEGASDTVKKEKEASAKEAFIARRSESSPSTYAPQRNFETAVPKDAGVSSALNAIAAVESRGSGDYAAIGPVVQKGMYKGQRAYGRYQVMEGNIPSWSKAALGRTISLEEFMADESAQDAIAAHQLQMSKDKFGTWEDAASVWFSGRPVAKAGTSSDGYTTVPEYINKFRRNFVRT